MRAEQSRLVVWTAGVSWDRVRGTDWHMATALARHARVLWVDPPVSPVTPPGRRNAGGPSFRPSLTEVDGQVTRLAPIALPGFSRPGIRETTTPLARAQIRWALRRLGARPFAVVSTHLEDMLGHWGAGVVDVFYGTDDYVAGAELMKLPAGRLRRQEQRVLARADVVAAVSPHLAQRWAGVGARPVVIPNGCQPPGAQPPAPPPGLPDLPRPVAGLVGQLSDRIDLSVLEAIAAAGVSLLIVGPLDPRFGQQRFADLIAAPNVHYTGPVPAGDVPAYLAAIDVGVTPYRDTAFNRASFPLKTLEYLGAGRPVVSSDLPAARWLRDDLGQGERAGKADQILSLVSANSEFPDAIRRMFAVERLSVPGGAGEAGHDRERAGWCREFAARHTWSRRADMLAAAIGI
jgi:teichuronic acid biosynthesis glycosyltransferase TuaH